MFSFLPEQFYLGENYWMIARKNSRKSGDQTSVQQFQPVSSLHLSIGLENPDVNENQ